MKLFFLISKLKILQKRKKTSSYIHPRNIPTDFENNPNIGCRVTDVDRRTDRPTDRPTDRRRATAIGPVDLKTTEFSCYNVEHGNYQYILKLFYSRFAIYNNIKRNNDWLHVGFTYILSIVKCSAM